MQVQTTLETVGKAAIQKHEGSYPCVRNKPDGKCSETAYLEVWNSDEILYYCWNCARQDWLDLVENHD